MKITKFVFALKWSEDDQVYNIHGLWPEEKIGVVKEPTFEEKLVLDDKELLKQLKKNWNSDIHKGNDDKEILEADLKFWNHEWNKHGRISGYDQKQYFQLALDLYEKYKSQTPVKKSGHQVYFYLDKDYNQIKKIIK